MRTVRLAAFLSFSALLVASIGAAAAERAKTVAMSGVVQDEKGRPAGDAIVETAFSGKRYSTTTDADGRFTIEVEMGKARFSGDKLTLPLRAASRDGKLQALRGFENGSDKPLVLKAAKEFPITVNDAEGKPVAGAQVMGNSDYMAAGDAITDGAGKTVLRMPESGSPQFILAIKSGVGLDYKLFWRKDEARTDPYRLEPGFVGPLTFTLNGMVKVRVAVKDEKGQAVGGVRIYPWLFQKPAHGADANLSGLTYFHRNSDERGMAEVEIPADQQRPVNVWAQLDGYTSRKRWMYDVKKDKGTLEVQFLKQIPLHGRVVDSEGKPVADAFVSASGACYDSFDGYHNATTTAADGTFEFMADPGMYYMFVARKERQLSAPWLGMIKQENPAGGIELKLAQGRRLTTLVTAGPDHKPVAGASINLVQNDDGSYYKLPKEQQFPVDPIGRPSIWLHASQNANTNEKGLAEFWLTPGSYQISTYSRGSTTPPQTVFTLADDNYYTVQSRDMRTRMIRHVRHDIANEVFQIEVNLEDAEPGPKLLKGRVVMENKPEVGVADVVLKGAGSDSTRPGGATDKDGKFSVIRGKSDLYLYAATSDGKLRGMRQIFPAENDVVVPIGPTASVHGRILDHEGKAMTGATIEYGVQINHEGGTFSDNFGGDVTATPEGWFTIEGLVPGFEYSINVATSFRDDGRAYGHTRASKVRAERAERIELGDLKLPAPYKPKTAADYAAEAFAKPEPFDQRLQAGLRRTNIIYQHLMIVLASPKSPPALKFFEHRFDYKDDRFATAIQDHLIMAVNSEDPSNGVGAWAERNKVRLPGPGFTMVVLDMQGKLIAQTTSDELSTNGELDRTLVMEFAKKYAPVTPDGRKMFDEALARAKAEGKNVLLEESSAYCGPCVVFAEYLEASKELIGRDYVCITLDRRFTGASDILNRLHQPNGTPWIAILNPEGKPLATSDGPDGNVGFEKPQWEKMLKATASKLTEGEIGVLVGRVKD